jgi:hypothetical protein
MVIANAPPKELEIGGLEPAFIIHNGWRRVDDPGCRLRKLIDWHRQCR